MRLPSLRTLLRRPPQLDDIADALLAGLAASAPAGRHGPDRPALPNLWTVRLDPADCARLADRLPRWSLVLAERLEARDEAYGVAYAGAVAVDFVPAPGLGTGRVGVERRRGNPTTDPHALRPLPGPLLEGHPRLVLPAGGTVRWGEAAAAGVERVLDLPAGHFVVGRAADADVHLTDLSVSPQHVALVVDARGDSVEVRDLGSRNGLLVDGVPVAKARLVDGNRLQLGDATLVYRRDNLADDGGRQGGERLDQAG
jgi:Inner membrane component of T3SS, cytoplasmic domain/Protein of unknown function (DUF3662)